MDTKPTLIPPKDSSSGSDLDILPIVLFVIFFVACLMCCFCCSKDDEDWSTTGPSAFGNVQNHNANTDTERVPEEVQTSPTAPHFNENSNRIEILENSCRNMDSGGISRPSAPSYLMDSNFDYFNENSNPVETRENSRRNMNSRASSLPSYLMDSFDYPPKYEEIDKV